MFAVPEVIKTEVFAEIPRNLRRATPPPERVASGRGLVPAGCMLEGPAFDRAGNLYFVDIAFGRIFRASAQGTCDVVAEYDGEPNGLRIHKDGRIFIADKKNGIMLLDPSTGHVAPLIARHRQERLRGVNDLTFASNGDMYFTDQGQSDLADPTGRVYRYTAQGELHRIADCIPSPNGLVLSAKENGLYVAATRANAIWHLPFSPDGSVARIGLHIQLSGGRGPDGMARDDLGGLVVAHPDMGAVWIFNRRGEPLYRVQSCCSDNVTNLAFGGPDRRTLYITDAGAGCIVMARVPTPGCVLYSHM